MKNERPLAAGLRAALAHRRLALVLWLSVAVPAGLVCTPLGRLTRLFDESPFRAPLLAGWDSWAMLSWQTLRPGEWGVLRALFVATFAAALLIQFFLTGGVLRTLMTGIPRPVFRRVVAESAALFKPSLWAGARYLFALALWAGLFVAVPARLLHKLAENRAPNGFFQTAQELWVVVVGLLVYYLVSLKFDLARIALARDEARNARGAYRLAKKRMKGARGRVLAVALFWTVAGLAVQALFTNLGVRMNPQTGAGIFWLVVVRQLGFVVSAMARVGFWASLIRFDEIRRDELAPRVPAPLPWEIPPAEPAPAVPA
ncbi:MAG TPA: hypothetical protein PLB02_02705 [Thermoanaerobaculia bacterium]|nr:hypothetical protein [Thermoanaerobaculia bacterium]HQR66282.1 hypothetical protein [Thermoanaerobaculia bacterium]